ncbi:hypothetical protein [Chryseobacterium sp. T16E-39]|uniref:hypothetical protein n=1 Tax=Chryseobacterium sp. T16E-39 TaxID=2015076 RepID=UPI0012FBF920|nr:hypothetical protein [Chryseobacterium sp. T16E-39]
MKKYLCLSLLTASTICGTLQAQCNSSTGCNGNTFLQSSDPNTIEYDNMVSTFHSTLVREASGKVLVWGENIANNGTSNVLSPTELNTANYPDLRGKILKLTGGSAHINTGQFVILTTEGLFIWGRTGRLVATTITNKTAFSKVQLQLPTGVNPEDVKMMFGTYGTIVLTTCSGEAWVLSFTGNKNGDGTAQNAANNQIWHRVKTGNGDDDFLTNVVAVRGSSNALMALTREGKIYTWGTGTYLGNGTSSANRSYATEMALPDNGLSGSRPKMIGVTSNGNYNSYLLLSSDGLLYSLGRNNVRQLGDFTTTERTSWVRVKKSASEDMTDIAWISPQEHDSQFASINVLTTNGKMYSWGNNAGSMLGETASTINPTYMAGGLSENDALIAMETGGHTSMVIKQCSGNFGYVGHRANGSMGNGSAASGIENKYNFSTSSVNLCGANTQPEVIDSKICPGSTIDLNTLHTGAIPTGYELKWYTTSTGDSGTEVPNPTTVGPGTYYAFYIPVNGSNCDNPPGSSVVISKYESGDPGYENCSCKIPIETGTTLSSKFGVSTKESQANNWPAQVPNGYIVLDSAKKGFVITHMTTAQINALTPVVGMIVYDTDTKCVKLYRGDNPTVAPERKGWVCIQQGCN